MLISSSLSSSVSKQQLPSIQTRSHRKIFLDDQGFFHPDLGSSCWHTESLAESWSSIGSMESELGNMPTSEMELVQGESCSSTCDIINLEPEPEYEESNESENGDLQSSVMSIISSTKEVMEADIALSEESDLRPPEALELLMCVEDPLKVAEIEEKTLAEPVFTHTSLLSEPLDFTLASVPIPEIISEVLDQLQQVEEPLVIEAESESVPQELSASLIEEPVSKAVSGRSASVFELPLLVVGGAALAVVGALVYRW
ncbi:hypothetical protein DNTS_003111, partial [Danionella cerebrum]